MRVFLCILFKNGKTLFRPARCWCSLHIYIANVCIIRRIRVGAFFIIRSSAVSIVISGLAVLGEAALKRNVSKLKFILLMQNVKDQFEIFVLKKHHSPWQHSTRNCL